MIITINGADGSGKSTIINAISESTNGEFTHYHSRPGNVLPKGNDAKQQKYVNTPSAVPKRRLCLQFAKIGLFLLEFHFLVLCHKLFSRKKLIVLERSLADLYVHPERYGLDNRFVDSIQGCLFDWYSDLNICLVGEPSVVANRKRELQASEISSLNERYLHILGKKMDRRLVIDTTNTSVPNSTKKLIERLRILLPDRVSDA